MLNKYIGTCLVCLVTAATGCGGGGSANVSDFCANYTAAVNGLVVKCLAAPQDAVDAMFQTQDASTCANMTQAVAAKRATYDSAKGQACLDELDGTACADLAAFGGPSDPCRQAVSGAVATGGDCYGDTDCQSGAFCEGVTGTNCPATCNAYAQQGDDCSQGQTCSPELSCDGSKCQATAAEGAACGGAAGLYCGNGLYCDGVNQAAGLCQAKKAKGGSCDSGTQCQLGLSCIGGSCDDTHRVGDTCSKDSDCGFATWCSSGNCTEYPGVDGSCGIQNGSSYVGCISSWCHITNQSTYTGSCTAYLALGAACSPNDFGSCGDAECDNGVCTAACAEQ